MQKIGLLAKSAPKAKNKKIANDARVENLDLQTPVAVRQARRHVLLHAVVGRVILAHDLLRQLAEAHLLLHVAHGAREHLHHEAHGLGRVVVAGDHVREVEGAGVAVAEADHGDSGFVVFGF